MPVCTCDSGRIEEPAFATTTGASAQRAAMETERTSNKAKSREDTAFFIPPAVTASDHPTPSQNVQGSPEFLAAVYVSANPLGRRELRDRSPAFEGEISNQ